MSHDIIGLHEQAWRNPLKSNAFQIGTFGTQVTERPTCTSRRQARHESGSRASSVQSRTCGDGHAAVLLMSMNYGFFVLLCAPAKIEWLGMKHKVLPRQAIAACRSHICG